MLAILFMNMFASRSSTTSWCRRNIKRRLAMSQMQV